MRQRPPPGASDRVRECVSVCRSDELIATGGDDLPRLEEIKEACNAEMASRMQQAAEALKEVLTSPTPVIMEGKIAGLARQGRIDNAMVELLEANLQQAQAAGEAGKGAVAVMTKLQQRVQTELDAKLSPPVALLRQLLRMDDALAREALLREKARALTAASDAAPADTPVPSAAASCVAAAAHHALVLTPRAVWVVGAGALSRSLRVRACVR
jgi:hypothetical protein